MSRWSLPREPLLHFAVLGALIFAVDAYARQYADGRYVIRIDDGIERSLISLFRQGQGRDPSEAEVSMLVHRWLQNEVYYREALSLGLDRGDEMIQSRLILKMREVVMNNLVVTPPSEQELTSWFEANRARYDRPERYDFSQILVADSSYADATQAEAVLAAMADPVPSPYAEQIRSYGARGRENITEMFGEAFASSLLADSEPKWRVARSRLGWHVARVDAVHPAAPASFDAIKAQVKADWESFQRTARAFDAIKEMRKRYTVTGPGLRYLDVQPAVPQAHIDLRSPAPAADTARTGQRS